MSAILSGEKMIITWGENDWGENDRDSYKSWSLHSQFIMLYGVYAGCHIYKMTYHFYDLQTFNDHSDQNIIMCDAY